jgi:hypothetical protein
VEGPAPPAAQGLRAADVQARPSLSTEHAKYSGFVDRLSVANAAVALATG